MNELTRAQARDTLAAFRAANWAQAQDSAERRAWIRDHTAIAGY